uniref:Uncharacterized protein n=2 Tax=Bacillus TaxID=1386 RepID=A0A1J0AKK5_BACIU|nr:LPXTG cell wall anchor domain-containing protein [Bacillus subtilis]APB62275.1 hypothetical protein pBS72_0060 [Bacillus subtilis]
MKKNSKKVVNGVLAAGIILGGGTTALLANPQTTFAALGDQADVYYSDENPGKGEITISQSNTEDNPAYVSGYLGQYFKGYAHKSATGVWQYHVDGYGDKEGVYNTVTDGQTLRVYMSEGKQQGAFDILVHIKENTGTDNDSNTGTTKPSTGTDNDSNTGTTKPSTGTDNDSNTDTTKPSTGTDNDSNTGTTKPSTGTDNDSNTGATKPSTGTDNDSNTGATKPSTGTDNDSNTGATKPSTGTDNDSNTGATKPSTGTDNDSNTGATKPSTGTDNDSNTGATKPSTGTDKVENNTVKNSNHTQTDSDQKAKKYSGDKLPKTGDSDSIYTMPIIGTILLLVAGAAAYINRKFIFGNK